LHSTRHGWRWQSEKEAEPVRVIIGLRWFQCQSRIPKLLKHIACHFPTFTRSNLHRQHHNCFCQPLSYSFHRMLVAIYLTVQLWDASRRPSEYQTQCIVHEDISPNLHAWFEMQKRVQKNVLTVATAPCVSCNTSTHATMHPSVEQST